MSKNEEYANNLYNQLTSFLMEETDINKQKFILEEMAKVLKTLEYIKKNNL